MVPGCVRKQDQQASVPCSSIAPSSVPDSIFILCVSASIFLHGKIENVSQINPFVPNLLFSRMLYHSSRKQTKTEMGTGPRGIALKDQIVMFSGELCKEFGTPGWKSQ